MISETVKIKILGLGGAGTNAVRDFLKIAKSPECAAIDTDLQSLLAADEIPERLLIKSENLACFLQREGEVENYDEILSELGKNKKFGASFSHEISLKNAVLEIIDGVDFLIISAGLGGETGGELAAAIARMARKRGTLALVFCILPFASEGDKKTEKALRDFEAIRRGAPAISLPNDITISREKLPILEAFRRANFYMNSAANSISKMILKKGIVNVDFKSFKEIFSQDFEYTVFCTGLGEGENYLEDALKNFDACPFCFSREPKKLLVNFNCPPDFDVSKMNAAFEHVSKKFGRRGDISFGACIDESLSKRLEICAIGITDERHSEENPPEENLKEAKISNESAVKTFENSVCIENATSAKSTENSANISEAKEFKSPNFQKQSEQIQNIAQVQAPAHEKTKVPPSNVDNADSGQTSEKQSKNTQEKKSEPKKFTFFGLASKVSKKKASDSSKEKILENQGEFSFVEMDQQRGFFSDTPPNMRSGVDIDIPTYMRKNIKINL